MKLSDLPERFQRWESTTLKLMGLISVIFSIALLIPAAYAISFGENFLPFVLPIGPLFVIGSILYLMFSYTKGYKSVNGISLVAVAWVFMFAICTIPYLFSGINLLDSVFEGVSGLTTTGMTVLGDIEGYPMSLLIWRSLTQWIGGITVVLIFLYFMPLLGVGRGLFENELTGSGSSQFIQKSSNAAKSFIIIYAVLSFLNFFLLVLFGVPFLESLCLMFTTISTGGLMIFNSNMSAYSDPVQWVTIFFMILGATNFYLHYRAFYKREKRVYRRNSEFKTMLAWFLAISLVITVLLIITQTDDMRTLTGDQLYETFKNSLFTTVSLGTTAGFFIEDFTLWPSQCIILLMFVAIIGASSSSTSGGVKFSRLKIIYAYLKNSFRYVTNANAVYTVKMDGSSVDESVVRSAILVFMMYAATLLIGSVIFMIFGFDMVDSIGLSISSISNGGMGFGHFGPTGDFASMSAPIKMILIFLMWMGRLEVVTALLLFTPGFWKELWFNSRYRRITKNRLPVRIRGGSSRR